MHQVLQQTPSIPRIALGLLLLAPVAKGGAQVAVLQDGDVVVVEYELVIAEQRLAPAGTEVQALTVNGGIPAPVLRFREGDRARIVVRNTLRDEEASIHWHGLLVPNVMDGVPYLTTPPIPPGGERVFEFTLRQSGTYWYHSHTGLQEQRGVYGAIVIDPRTPDLEFDREHVVVLSDWTNEDPGEVMRTLMRAGEWYGIVKGTAQSVLGAWRAGELGEYFEREKIRMPPMDVSDVAYDAFLANGVRELRLDAEPGERVLLRGGDSGASTYFPLTSAAGPMTIVGADGQRVEPVEVVRLLMGMAETYDLIVTMPEDGAAIEVLATAQDATGSASIVLGEGSVRRATAPPAPELYSMDEMLMAGLESLNPERGRRAADAERPFVPYALLRATHSTALPAAEDESNVRRLTMRLTGDMQRYLWGIDGKTLSEESVIPVSAGEVLRIEIINDTMMHHPMHLHGHFFRLLNGQGEHSPLKHTVDVPPMGTRTIEWVADEEAGDWFFHCHLLYHMDAGMARVFSYTDQGPEHEVSLDPQMIDPTFVFLNASIQTSMTMGNLMLMRGRDDFGIAWDTGLDSSEHSDREVDLYWSRYLSPDLTTVLGYRFADVVGAEDRAFGGARYRLPYFVMTTLTLDSEGDLRLQLDKEQRLMDRLTLFGRYEFDTNTDEEWTVGARWTASKSFGFVIQEHSGHGFGAGLFLRL